MTVTVHAIPVPPLAVDDSASTSEDTAVVIDVAANDSDPDGNLDPNSANSSCANGSTGCLGAANGSLTDHWRRHDHYTPTPDFNGSDSFVYEICDTGSLCATAAVTITVHAIPDPPLAVGDSAATSEDTAVVIAVAANDSDPDGNLEPTSANTTCANGSTGCLGAANGTPLTRPRRRYHHLHARTGTSTAPTASSTRSATPTCCVIRLP